LDIHVEILLELSRILSTGPRLAEDEAGIRPTVGQEKKTPGCERTEARKHSRAIAWGQI
jgi:hypothetical protein